MPVQDYSRVYPTTAISSGLAYIIKNTGFTRLSFQVTARVVITSRAVNNDTGVNITDNTLTTVVTPHTYYTGMVVQLTSTGTLPTGLALATNYYVFANNTQKITLFTTQAQALAATQDNNFVTTSPGVVDITALGTAGSTITITPVTLSGASYSVQWSNDYVPNPEIGSLTPINAGNWIAATSGETQSTITNNITATGTTAVSSNNPAYAYARILFALSAGTAQITVSCKAV